MFDAGFEPAHVLSGRAWGWERRFGQPSVRNWGTTEAPAPTSSLSRGSHCDGLLLGLPVGRSGSILTSLVKREANEPISLPVSTEFGDVSAFTWLMSDTWAQLGVEQLAVHGVENIRAGGGPSGNAWRYASGVRDTLYDHGLHDGLVSRYVDALQPGAEATNAPPDASMGPAPPPA